MLSGIKLSGIKLSGIKLSGIKLSVVILNIIIVIAAMLSVILQNVKMQALLSFVSLCELLRRHILNIFECQKWPSLLSQLLEH